MLMCLKCSKLNNPDENYCVYCGASLPKLAYAIEMAPVEENMELYYKFVDAVDKVKAGGSLEEYEAFLVDIAARLKERDDDLRDFFDYDIEEEIKDDFVEEFSTGFDGLDAIAEGVDLFFGFFDEENTALLDQGLAKIKEGLLLIHKARRLNRQREKGLSMDADCYRANNAMEL